MKKVNPDDLINGWLKHHNTTLKQVQENHPEWMENPNKHTREFYRNGAKAHSSALLWVG